jgi:hypothetical protein
VGEGQRPAFVVAMVVKRVRRRRRSVGVNVFMSFF